MLSIAATLTSERIHSWPNAPSDRLHVHLQSPHRHLMHVRVEVRVDEADRQISFEALRANVYEAFDRAVPRESTFACEEMAVRLGRMLVEHDPGLHLLRIEVSEDGESFGIWTADAPASSLGSAMTEDDLMIGGND